MYTYSNIVLLNLITFNTSGLEIVYLNLNIYIHLYMYIEIVWFREVYKYIPIYVYRDCMV